MAKKKMTFRVTGPYATCRTRPGETFEGEFDEATGMLHANGSRATLANLLAQGALKEVKTPEKKAETK